MRDGQVLIRLRSGRAGHHHDSLLSHILDLKILQLMELHSSTHGEVCVVCMGSTKGKQFTVHLLVLTLNVSTYSNSL